MQHHSLKSPLRFHDNPQHWISVLLRSPFIQRSSSPSCWCKHGAVVRQWTVSLQHHHQLRLQQKRSDVIRCGDFSLRPSSLLRFSLFDIKLRPQRVRRLSEVAPPKKNCARVHLFVYSSPLPPNPLPLRPQTAAPFICHLICCFPAPPTVTSSSLTLLSCHRLPPRKCYSVWNLFKNLMGVCVCVCFFYVCARVHRASRPHSPLSKAVV